MNHTETNPRNGSALPSWLTDNTPLVTVPRSKEHKQLVLTVYESLFEIVLEGICKGRTLKSIIENEPTGISYEGFWQWIKNNPARRQRYDDAQEVRAELMAAELLSIANGDAEGLGSDDAAVVNRDRLRVDTIKWLMKSYNRSRFGDSAQVNLDVGVSIRAALQSAQQRIEFVREVDDSETPSLS